MMKLLKCQKLSTSGGVSLLSVVIFATIITIIITTYTTLTLYQQHESINFDSSNRAYYAAQSGFADTVAQINSGRIKAADYLSTGGKKQDCNPVATSKLLGAAGPGIIGSGSNKVEYTCQLIDFMPTRLTKDNLDESTAAVFPLHPGDKTASTYTFSIEWVKQGAIARAWNQRMALPPYDQWKSGPSGTRYIPLMRAMFFWSDNNEVNRNNIRNRTFFLVPAPSPGEDSNFDSTKLTPEVIMSGDGGLSPQNNTTEGLTGLGNTGILGVPMYSTRCQGDTCTSYVVVKNADLNNRQIFVALRPIYGSVDSVSVGVQDNYFASGQATIDITGKSGSAYRRIKQSVPYGDAGKVMTSYFPDYSLVSGDGICKLYKTNTFTAENNGCPQP